MASKTWRTCRTRPDPQSPPTTDAPGIGGGVGSRTSSVAEPSGARTCNLARPVRLAVLPRLRLLARLPLPLRRSRLRRSPLCPLSLRVRGRTRLALWPNHRPLLAWLALRPGHHPLLACLTGPASRPPGRAVRARWRMGLARCGARRRVACGTRRVARGGVTARASACAAASAPCDGPAALPGAGPHADRRSLPGSGSPAPRRRRAVTPSFRGPLTRPGTGLLTPSPPRNFAAPSG